jgi:hypothetical protein
VFGFGTDRRDPVRCAPYAHPQFARRREPGGPNQSDGRMSVARPDTDDARRRRAARDAEYRTAPGVPSYSRGGRRHGHPAPRGTTYTTVTLRRGCKRGLWRPCCTCEHPAAAPVPRTPARRRHRIPAQRSRSGTEGSLLYSR